MNALAGAVVGVIAAFGIWIALLGATGVGVSDRPSRSFEWGDTSWRVLLWLAIASVVWLVTGWPAAGGLAGAATAIAPKLTGARRSRRELEERTESLASWAEMLRDTISAHAGLREAIAVTARVAPPPIRREVQALSVRAEREPLPSALSRFAADVDDPVADLIVAALVIAAERQAQRLADLLSEIATSARQQAAMRMRIETGRARTYASSRALVVITLGLAVLLMLFSPKFMSPYDTATGQAVMLGIGALFAGALWGLVRMSRPAPVPRLLSAGREGAAG